MLDQLPAFVSAVMGGALSWELLLLTVFVLVLTVRTTLRRGLRWYLTEQDEEGTLRRKLWRLLKAR